ncbi:MAG TPA: hypothetical protein VKB50_22250 [Vicinamibacterales bacterium]|nr:hypothetical protein [Vicinamibacterales bacterium]
MLTRSTRLFFLLILAGVLVACGRKKDEATPIATPSLKLSRTEASIGSPIEMTYRFVMAPNAPALTEDYTVFVHVLDSDREQLWGDDHQPPTPAREWKPGSTIEYTRTMFVPRVPYVGDAQIEVGLYSKKTGGRVPLGGENTGDRAIRVGSLAIRLAADSYFVVFRNGWYDAEVTDSSSGNGWQWSKKQGNLSFRNPKRDTLLMIQLDQPAMAFSGPQQVEVRAGQAVVDSFPLAAGRPELRRISLPPEKLGTGENVDLSIVVDKTFVPASIPQLKSLDSRELGVRVFHVFVEPKQ